MGVRWGSTIHRVRGGEACRRSAAEDAEEDENLTKEGHVRERDGGVGTGRGQAAEIRGAVDKKTFCAEKQHGVESWKLRRLRVGRRA